jgi:hypothetical protein
VADDKCLKQQPNGTWLLRVYVGRDESGRVKHRSRTFRGTRREAQRELARLVTQEVDSPSGLEDDTTVRAPPRWGVTTTVNDAIAGWQLNGWDDL